MMEPDFAGKSYVALATDYDGTLAEEGIVSAKTVAALERFKSRSGKLILVTGRILGELTALFPQIDIFDLVVAENGALLHWPGSGETRALSEPPPPGFVEKLTQLGVGPIAVGHCIVATWTPHEGAVIAAIKEMQLELSITFNKGAVMILPNGVNKASGLEAALAALSLAPSETVAIGDAENDLAMLKLCGFSVAVSNALDSVKKEADWVTAAPRGQGVSEMLDVMMMADAQT